MRQTLQIFLGASLLAAGSLRGDVFTDVPEAAAYSLVYSLDIPAIQGAYNTTAIPYGVDNSAAFPEATFERVAYYLELAGSTDPARPNGFVYVSFDRPAVFLDGGDLGVPSNGSNGSRVATNTSVANLTVVSNIPGIANGTSLVGGKLEFWPSNYSPGANGLFDHDDSGFSTANGYGSMQIHNTGVPQTLIAFNNWGGANVGQTSDLGAGNNPGPGQPDWTFSDSAGSYTVRRMQILVKPVGNLVEIVNPSFEVDAIQGANAPISQARTTAPQGWMYSGGATQGLLAPDASGSTEYSGTTPGFTGAKVHFNSIASAAAGPVLMQTLSSTLEANTFYTLSLSVGNRSVGTWGGQKITLRTSSGKLVGEWVGASRHFTAPGTFGRTKRSFATGTNPSGLGEKLQIVIEQPAAVVGRYLDVDNVQLIAEPVATRPEGTPVDVFIVAGQSNTQGWQARVSALSDTNKHYADAPHRNAMLAYKQNKLGDVLYNTGSMGQLGTLGAGFAGAFEGFGPELSFGSDVASRLPRKVAIIKFAAGGAGLDNHLKKGAALYPLLIAQVNDGMAQLRAQGFLPQINGMFWLQGETDAIGTGTDSTDAASYAKNISDFVADVRADLNVPNLKFHLTEINGNMPAFSDKQQGVLLVNQGMISLASTDPNVVFIPTADITSGFADNIHYNANQIISIGQRWANAGVPIPPEPTVYDRVSEPAAEGYQVLYELDLPSNAGYRDAIPVPYSVDNSLSVSPYDRVAYYLELKDATGTHWVYASMDAFTSVPTQLGLPHNRFNPVLHQRTVENLNVFSSEANVATGTFIDSGFIEMWPNSYTGPGLSYASTKAYDWGDTPASTSSAAIPAPEAGYGSFQVHNPVARQTVLAYNRWGLADSANDDVGIGNRKSPDTDWTLSGSAASYSARKLVILVRPRTVDVAFTQIPRNRALVPRDRITNEATVNIVGTENSGGYQSAILRVYRNGVFQSESGLPLAYTGGVADIVFAPRIPAELASYDFEIWLTQGTTRRLVKKVTEVVAGDALLFYGQSNAEAAISYSPNNTTSNNYASNWVRTFGQNADSGEATRNALLWDKADGDGGGSTFRAPGAVGQWAIVVARMITATEGIPVALLNGARGGYNMEQLKKDDLQPDNLDDTGTITRPYNRLRFRAIQGGVADSARAIFYYQGESDFGDAQAHATGFANLYADWQLDYPRLEHIYEVQVRPGCGVVASDVALRQAQRKFGDIYPLTSVMATNGISSHAACHYQFINGYETLGLHHFRQISRDLYGGPAGPDIDALNPASVHFVDLTRKRIEVVLRNVGATINFDPEALADFAVTGNSAKIVGAAVSGHSFVLELDQPAAANAALEYRGHLGAGGWVTNANGVGLLSFSEPVVTLDPLAVPTALIASPGNGTVTLAWSPSAGAETYSVRRANTSGGPYNTIATNLTGTGFSDTSSSNGFTYYYVVSASVGARESGFSNEAAATPQPPPQFAPANLVAIAGDAQVSLSWSASAEDSTYNLKRSLASGGPFEIIATGLVETSYIDAGVSNGTTYYYVVSAATAGGEGPDSTEVGATPRLPLPSVPGGLTALAGDARVSLGWQTSSKAERYNLKRASSSGGPYATIATVTGITYVDAAVTNGEIYYYVVTAVNASGESNNSNVASAAPQIPPPAAPTHLAATAGASKALLGWAAADRAASYTLKRATISGGPYVTVATDITVTNYTDTGLTNGTTYFYVVSSVNAGGVSANSNETSVRPVPDAIFSGRAIVAGLTVLGTSNTWSDTGQLPPEGGAQQASTLTLDEPGLLAVEVGYAFTLGQADRTRSEASAADIALNLGSLTVEADFAMARALAVWQVNGSTAIAGGAEIGDLTIAGIPTEVTGTPNQVIALPIGRIVINEQIPTETGILVNALHVILADGTDVVVCSAQAGFIAQTPPTIEGDTYLSGGGWIRTQSGAKGSFSLVVDSEGGVLTGHLNFKDHGTGMKVESTGITGLGQGTSTNSRRIEGQAKIDGVSGFTYVVEATDNGEPGDADTFSIDLSNGYHAAGTLGGGNIQLHQPGQ